METVKKELTTEELIARIRKGKEWRDKGRVKTVIPLLDCDFTFALPPVGILERKLAACRAGGTKKVESLVSRLLGKNRTEAAAIYAEYQHELEVSEEEILSAENEVYADYVEDIRDRTISPEGKSFVKISTLLETAYLSDLDDITPDTVVPFSREIVLLFMQESRLRNWIIKCVSDVSCHNLFRKESALKNSGPSRNGAHAESQPAPIAPTESSNSCEPSAEPSSTSTSTRQDGSMTNGAENS